MKIRQTLRSDRAQGSVAIAGAAVKWLRDNLKIIKDNAEISATQLAFWGSSDRLLQIPWLRACLIPQEYTSFLLFLAFWRLIGEKTLVGAAKIIPLFHTENLQGN